MKALILVLLVIILSLQSFPQTQIRFDNSGFANFEEVEKINNEPSIAVNPMNNNNIVIATNYRELTGSSNPDYTSAHLGIYNSFDNGNTWNFRYLPKMNKIFQGDPTLSFSTNGILWAGYVGANSSSVVGDPNDHKAGIYANFSTNGGNTWRQNSFIIEEESSIKEDLDKPFIYVSPYSGNVYIAYRFLKINETSPITETIEIRISKYNNELNSFSPIKTIDQESFGTNAPFLLCDPNENIYVFYFQKDNDYSINCIKLNFSEIINDFEIVSEVEISTLQMIGRGTEPPTYLGQEENKFRVNCFPSAAIDNNNTLYVVWSDKSLGNADIMLSKSTDLGVTWSNKVPLNNQSIQGEQFFPFISCRSDTLDILCYHMSTDVSTEIVPTYFTSSNGGVSFDMTSFTDNIFYYSNTSFPTNQNFIGDYLWLTSSNTDIVAAYVNNNRDETGETSQFGIYTAFIPRSLHVLAKIEIAEVPTSALQLKINNEIKNLAYAGSVIPIKPFISTPYEIVNEYYNSSTNTYKFRNWDFTPQIFSTLIYENYDYTSENLNITSEYNQTHPLTVTNNLEGGTGGTYKVTWDKKSSEQLTLNSGESLAAFDGTIIPDNYTVFVENFPLLNTDWCFLNWDNGTTNNPRTEVISATNKNFTANYKGNLRSNNSTASGSNGQRKLMRDQYGIYHLVYTSMNTI